MVVAVRVLSRALLQHACNACWSACQEAHLGLCPMAYIPQKELLHCPGHLSRLHEEVSGALLSVGVQHTNQHVTQDGLFCVDIALQGGKVSILLGHFFGEQLCVVGASCVRGCLPTASWVRQSAAGVA